MLRTKTKPGNEGHQSGPQSHGDQQKGNVNDMRPGHQTHPGQPGKQGQQEGERGEPQKSGKPDIGKGGTGPKVPGHGAESLMMSHGQQPGGGKEYEDEDEKQDAAEKEAFRERQSSHPGISKSKRDAGRIGADVPPSNPKPGKPQSGN
ncbi:MAG: hypothetical protein ACP5QA_13140 [Phycisphaerae bacterium]